MLSQDIYEIIIAILVKPLKKQKQNRPFLTFSAFNIIKKISNQNLVKSQNGHQKTNKKRFAKGFSAWWFNKIFEEFF